MTVPKSIHQRESVSIYDVWLNMTSFGGGDTQSIENAFLQFSLVQITSEHLSADKVYFSSITIYALDLEAIRNINRKLKGYFQSINYIIAPYETVH